MSFISILTDFGLSDNFVGVIKAVILRINPQAKIIDITHQVRAQSILEGAFLLKAAYRYFPQGTVHLAVVDPGVGTCRRKIIVKTQDYFFVAPDNGLLWPVLKEARPSVIIEITNDKYFLKPVSNTFHARDIFAPVAAYLSKKKDNLFKFGREIKSIERLDLPSPKIKGNFLEGEIIYIDHFGNLVSNIDKTTFKRFVKKKSYKIYIKKKVVGRLSDAYQDVEKSKPLALFNSFGYLEIALNCGSAKDFFKTATGQKFIIKVD